MIKNQIFILVFIEKIWIWIWMSMSSYLICFLSVSSNSYCDYFSLLLNYCVPIYIYLSASLHRCHRFGELFSNSFCKFCLFSLYTNKISTHKDCVLYNIVNWVAQYWPGTIFWRKCASKQ